MPRVLRFPSPVASSPRRTAHHTANRSGAQVTDVPESDDRVQPASVVAEPASPSVVEITEGGDQSTRRVALVPTHRPERLDLEPDESGIRRGDVDAYGRSEQMRAIARRL